MPHLLSKRKKMNLCHNIKTNQQFAKMVRSIGFKLLGEPKNRSQISRCFLAIYFIDLVLPENKRILDAYNNAGKENVFISLYNSETLLEDVEKQFIEEDYRQIVLILSKFLMESTIIPINYKSNPT